MKRILHLPTFLLTLLASACSTAPKAPPIAALLEDDYTLTIEFLEKYIPAQMEKYKLMGLSVAIVDDQQVVWSDGFGFSDQSTNTSATQSTNYRAGSVSKLFTALAVMQLAENGKVDLDAPIADSVPEFQLQSRFGSTDEITLRNILSHHAGIPGNIIDGMWTKEPDSFKTVTTRLGRYYAAYPPETVFAYSNAGYSLAGHAVENISGMPFTRYMNESVLQALEMNQSNFEFDTTSEQASKSYLNRQEVTELPLRDLPAGGLITTVGDLSNLLKMVNANGFYKEQILQPETLQKMLTIQDYDSVFEPNGFNALGWFHFSRFLDDQYTVVGHTGQTMAHSAFVAVAPAIKLGVVLLANSPSNGGLESIADEIFRLSHIVKTHKTLASLPAKMASPNKPLPGVETGFDGQFASSFGYLDIRSDSDNYKLSVDGTKLKLSRNKDDGFSLRAQLLGFIPVKLPGIGDRAFFAREVSGEKMIFSTEGGEQTNLVATQISHQERQPVWDALLGDYVITNPIETDIPLFKIDNVKLIYADGLYQLLTQTPMAHAKQPLMVINDSEATLQGYGRGLGETLIVQADGSLLHAGLIFRKTQ